jgi:hypothetical protein
MSRFLKYKDTLVQQGSALYELLQSNKPEDKKKAEALYKEVDQKFMKNWPADKLDLLNWRVGDQTVNAGVGTLSCET